MKARRKIVAHLKLCLATVTHNFKWFKIAVAEKQAHVHIFYILAEIFNMVLAVFIVKHRSFYTAGVQQREAPRSISGLYPSHKSCLELEKRNCLGVAVGSWRSQNCMNLNE